MADWNKYKVDCPIKLMGQGKNWADSCGWCQPCFYPYFSVFAFIPRLRPGAILKERCFYRVSVYPKFGVGVISLRRTSGPMPAVSRVSVSESQA